MLLILHILHSSFKMSSPSPAGSRSRSSDVAAIGLRMDDDDGPLRARRSYVRSPVFFALPSSSPCRRLHLAVVFTLLSSLHLAADGPASWLPRNRTRTDPRVFLTVRTVVVVAIFLSVTRVRPGKSLARVSPSLLNASTALSTLTPFTPGHRILSVHC